MIDDDAIATEIVAAFPDTAVVYRFGSTSSGQDRAGSDVDLAFLPARPVDPVRRFEVQEALAARLRRDVDLVDLASASTVMQMQVVSGGDAIRTLDARRREEFEDRVYSLYPRFNEERAGILLDIRRTGQVHGG